MRSMVDAPEITAGEEPSRPAGLSGRQVALLWVVLTLALAPGIMLIRALALEVTQYQPASFESYARESLAKGDYDRVIELCTGALKTGVNRSDHWGKVYALRAQAYAGMNNLPKALSELESCAAFWTKKYYYATDEARSEIAEFGTALGRRFLDAGNVDDALRAFSAAGVGSGKPAEYLEQLTGKLSAEQKTRLWPETPFLMVQDFRGETAGVFEKLVEEQGRRLQSNRIDSSVSRTGKSSALLEVSESTEGGRSWYGAVAYLPVSEKPFALRVYVREQTPTESKVLLTYWFDSARKSADTVNTATETLADGWKRFDIRRDFYKEQLAEANGKGYSITDGIINNIGLSLAPGPANRFWVDRVELYLPGNS